MDIKKVIKRCLFIVLVAGLLLMMILIIARYEVEGEKDVPFYLSKVLVVSSVDGKNNEDENNIWNIDFTQNNDVFVYINRDENTKDVINSISFENFKIEEDRDNIKIYRPTGELDKLYTYSEEDYKDKSIIYSGEVIDDIKNLEISNVGGVCGFRVTNEKIGSFVSNEERDEIVYDGKLLNEIGITRDDIKVYLTFDIIIETSSKIKYKCTVSIDMPVDGLFENGKGTLEVTNFDNVVFKRV